MLWAVGWVIGLAGLGCCRRPAGRQACLLSLLPQRWSRLHHPPHATDPHASHPAPAPASQPPVPAPQQQVLRGEGYVNNEKRSDVTFVVEGRPFHAHRIALLGSSEIFRSMFDGHYREKDASTIPIPNLRHEVFERMMQCIYTGAWVGAWRVGGWEGAWVGGCVGGGWEGA